MKWNIIFVNIKDTGEVWVYHGTNDENIQKIMSGGFKVGGIDIGIKVHNGSSYGLGKYEYEV